MPVAYERDCIKYGRLKTVEIGPARASRQMGWNVKVKCGYFVLLARFVPNVAKRSIWDQCDLDLDSTRIQVDALGHTLTPFWSVLGCHLCFLPGDSHPWQVLVDGAPPVCTLTTWTPLEPRNLPVQRLSRYTLVIHSYHMSKPTESSFTEHVIHAILSSSGSNLFICYSVLPGDTQDAPLPSVTGSVQPVSVAVRGHTSAVYRRVDRTIASYNLIFTFSSSSTFRIFDMSIRSWDICDQTRQLLKIALNFGRFYPPKFCRGTPVKLVSTWSPRLWATSALVKFCEVTPTTPKVINALM